MQWKQATALVLGTWALCGCTTVENEMWGLRYGPQPVLVNEVVQTSMQRQLAAVAAVSSDIDTVTGQRIALAWPARQDRREWYTLILRGFNTIDDACMSYVDSLWIMERQKTRNSTILYAAGAAGAALIAAAQTTPSTAAALVVLSQAFGFAGVLNNAVFDTYLYSQNASTIKRIIQKTTLEYRSDLAENIGGDEVTYPIASVDNALHLIAILRDRGTLASERQGVVGSEGHGTDGPQGGEERRRGPPFTRLNRFQQAGRGV